MNSGSFKNFNYKLFAYNIYIYIYMCVCVCVCVYEQNLILNKPEGLMCHKKQPKQTKQ